MKAVAMRTDNAELIEQARAGDRQALERLMAVCMPDLQRYARRNCQSDDIEEAVQDALWILYRNVSGLKSVAAFASWLFQVVRRICLGYARRKRHLVPIDLLPAAAELDQTAADPELRAVLSLILSGLPKPYREAIVLRDIEGLSAEQMADVLGISVEAAKSRLHRSRAMVREQFDRTTAETKLSSATGVTT
jgi:RNA polymerase sigma factor (sigma-70 family)